MFHVGSNEYTICGYVGELPSTFRSLVEHAVLHDDFNVKGSDGTLLCVSVGRDSSNWPELIVTQRIDPGPESGFMPGGLLIPEHHIFLIGAGTRLLAYDLREPRRLWEDTADVGFLAWKRHGRFVLMSAELELAAWDLTGSKLWSTYVEPPWEYAVSDARVQLDVMGKLSSFDITTGPRSASLAAR